MPYCLDELLGEHDGLAITIVIAALAAVVFKLALRRGRIRTRNLQHLARKRGMRLVELMRLVSMAESSAHLGLWHYYPDEKRQEWSGGMKELFGLEADTELLDGDAETLLASNDIDLVGHVMEHEHGSDVSSTQFEIRRWDGSRRVLQVQTCHLGQSKGGRDRVLGVLADVTDRAADQWSNPRLHAVPAAIEQVELVERQTLMTSLDRHVIDFRKNKMPVSLLLFEIVGGSGLRRAAADKLRSEFASISHEYMRSGDLLGRLDADEYAWLAAGADEHFAQLIAERLRCAFVISGLTSVFDNECIEIGIASARDGDTALSLFARADGSLGRAKKRSLVPMVRVA